MHKGFTIIEVVIVLVIIGIIVLFAAPQFAVTKERALDKEAKAVITLIQAAEKLYKMEESFYYPQPTGTTINITEINKWLKLNLPPASSSGWVYSINSTPLIEKATATRNKTGGRAFSITFTSDDISCTPNSDTCPP